MPDLLETSYSSTAQDSCPLAWYFCATAPTTALRSSVVLNSLANAPAISEATMEGAVTAALCACMCALAWHSCAIAIAH